MFVRRRDLLAGGFAALASPAAAQSRLDPARVARSLAELIDLEYPDADAASALASVLQTNARRGNYRNLAPAALAERLTADLRAGIHDQHLNVVYDPDHAEGRARIQREAPAPSRPTPATPSARARAFFEPDNYGVAGARVLSGNIGLLEISEFDPLYDVTREKYAAAMRLVADTWGLILDLRSNGGGDSASSTYFTSYFFDREPFVLSRMMWRRLPAEENVATRDVLGGSYGEQRPLFVLVSRETFSAAEAVAYDLQAFGRAQVVGEVSRGGANPGDFFNIGQGFVAFVPQGRAVSAVTGGNWEGVGVRPDIPVDAAQALDAAHRAAMQAALAQTSDAARQATLREALEE